jgi:hypothetical protein
VRAVSVAATPTVSCPRAAHGWRALGRNQLPQRSSTPLLALSLAHLVPPTFASQLLAHWVQFEPGTWLSRKHTR